MCSPDFFKIETITVTCPHCGKPFRKRSHSLQVFCQLCFAKLASGEAARELAKLRKENNYLHYRCRTRSCLRNKCPDRTGDTL